MGLETGTYISDFVVTNPADSDPANQLDDHIRLVKSFITATFAGSVGDDYDEPVTATSDQIDSWESRLTSLEAQPTTLASPKSGMVTMSSNQTYSVTGLGFQPNHIVAYCVDYWLSVGSSYHSFGVASWSATNADTAISVDAAGSVAALSTVATLTNLFLATVYPSQNTRTEVAISNVGSDGFDLSFDKFSGGARVMYLAFQ